MQNAKVWAICLGIGAALMILKSYQSDDEPYSKITLPLSATAASFGVAPGAEQDIFPTKWDYSTTVDKIDQNSSMQARLFSLNEDFQSAIGAGWYKMALVFERTDGGPIRAVLELTRGSFDCRSKCSAKIRVDDQISEITLAKSASYRPHSIIVDNAPGLYAKIRAAKKLVIEAPVVGASSPQFEYNVANIGDLKNHTTM